MINKPRIDQYLISTCLFIVDEFNQQFRNTDKTELKKIANEEFTEADLSFRIGMPFRHMAYFENGKKQGTLAKTDIFIKEKDFRIEVKYLRNFLHANKVDYSASMEWKAIKGDFDWLSEEIRQGRKYKSAFVVGWFNYFNYFGQIIQLGSGKGKQPNHDPTKTEYFPFLIFNGPKTKDIEIAYKLAYQPQNVPARELKEYRMDCILIGTDEDKFNIALYY